MAEVPALPSPPGTRDAADVLSLDLWTRVLRHLVAPCLRRQRHNKTGVQAKDLRQLLLCTFACKTLAEAARAALDLGALDVHLGSDPPVHVAAAMGRLLEGCSTVTVGDCAVQPACAAFLRAARPHEVQLNCWVAATGLQAEAALAAACPGLSTLHYIAGGPQAIPSSVAVVSCVLTHNRTFLGWDDDRQAAAALTALHGAASLRKATLSFSCDVALPRSSAQPLQHLDSLDVSLTFSPGGHVDLDALAAEWTGGVHVRVSAQLDVSDKVSAWREELAREDGVGEGRRRYGDQPSLFVDSCRALQGVGPFWELQLRGWEAWSQEQQQQLALVQARRVVLEPPAGKTHCLPSSASSVLIRVQDASALGHDEHIHRELQGLVLHTTHILVWAAVASRAGVYEVCVQAGIEELCFEGCLGSAPACDGNAWALVLDVPPSCKMVGLPLAQLEQGIEGRLVWTNQAAERLGMVREEGLLAFV